MITLLRVGMHVRLPSGNVVILVSQERGIWLCEYTRQSKLRGEVEFSGVYLRRFGVTKC